MLPSIELQNDVVFSKWKQSVIVTSVRFRIESHAILSDTTAQRFVVYRIRAKTMR